MERKVSLRYNILCAAYRLQRTGDGEGRRHACVFSLLSGSDVLLVSRATFRQIFMSVSCLCYTVMYVLHIACSGREKEREGDIA